mmetsp:Transcript_5566/g.16156  ORF Transcript_5566/g.16156 Transcript_5566/m.16156 type:complete len:400 (-) Transcript_5566:74-1273(-)
MSVVAAIVAIKPGIAPLVKQYDWFSRPNHVAICSSRRPLSLTVFLIMLATVSFCLMPGCALTTAVHSYHSVLRHPSSSGFPSRNQCFTPLFSTPGYGSGERTSKVVPTKKAKHRSRVKPKKREHVVSSKKGPLSKHELGHHVASKYVKGPGSLFRNTAARRRRMEEASRLYHTDPSHKNHVNYLKKLDGHPALVLNADYQPLCMLPLSLWSWQEAVKAVFNGKVTVVDVYPNVNIRAVNLDVPLPSVIALNDYAPRVNQKPAFTRRNVFLRDSYRCQYCAQYYRTSDLSLDHYIPRSQGGKLIWENTVTCCRKCNGRKGSRLPSELGPIGMRVLREPRCPSTWELAAEAGKMLPRKVHSTWAPYLGIDVEDAASMQNTEGGKVDADSDGINAMFEDVDV